MSGFPRAGGVDMSVGVSTGGNTAGKAHFWNVIPDLAVILRARK